MTPTSRTAPARGTAAAPTRRALLRLAAATPLLALPFLPARAQSTTERGQVIDLRVAQTFERLKSSIAGARELSERAKGVLVIPGVTKAGFLIGGAYGEGALLINGMSVGHYSMAAASFGLQAGAQTYDLALFFMTTPALEGFRRSNGWELGADAEVTVPQEGLAASLNTTTSRSPIIALVFGQTGLMAGVSVAGGKYTPIVR